MTACAISKPSHCPSKRHCKARLYKPTPHTTEGKTSGSHGYDNASEYMQAIFIGHGPAFKAGKTIPAFSNIELYNLMCRILGLTPAANDGNPAWPDSVLGSDTKTK